MPPVITLHAALRQRSASSKKDAIAANPCNSLVPRSAEKASISNRHRILRIGSLYREDPGGNPGLLFVCLNGDMEPQFEFIQQTWLVGPSFHGRFPAVQFWAKMGNGEGGRDRKA